MDNARWQQIQELFHSVADLPPSEQDDYLQSACGVDSALKDEVMAMLRQDADAGSLLDRDLPDAVPGLLGAFAESVDPSDFAPYRIIKVIGEGGMGIVHLAVRDDIGHSVALKVLRDGTLSSERRERFASEQETLAHLEHPAIAQIFHAGFTRDHTPWFAMEYIEGEPVTDYCRTLCAVEDRLRIFRGVCEAVQFAHQHLIIHRDIKPSNVLVKTDGTVKLLDFGIAKQLEDSEQPVEQTLTALHPMTLAYASPEQIRGKPLGMQTDIYSLGVILYEILTEARPFDLTHLSRAESERIILNDEPVAPSSAAKRLTAEQGSPIDPGRRAWKELDALCLTAMHKDPRRRYTSVESLIRDIDHYLKHEPLEARPDSWGYRLGKFIVRNRLTLSTATAMTLLIVGLVAFFVIRLSRARNAALAQTRRTERIEGLMLDLFNGGDKAAGPAEDLRVVALLERGVKDAKTLSAEPAVQAELYQTLGHAYESLGKFDAAEPLLHSARDIQTATTGADSPETAESIMSVGLLRLDEGRVPDAEQLVNQGLAMYKRHLPQDDPAVTKAEAALGHVLEERGAYKDALNILNSVVQRESKDASSTSEYSSSIHLLANAHYYLNDLALAESLDKQALDMDTKFYGAAHPRVADVAFDLGEVQHDLSHDAEAERYYKQSLRINQAWYGTENPRTAISMIAVGQSLVYQLRYDEAAPFLQQGVAIQEHVLSSGNPQVAMGYNTLGVLELRRGHFAEAEKDFTRMKEIYAAVYGDRHNLVAVADLNLGQVYLAEKQYPHAESEYRDALSRFKENFPGGHVNTFVTENQLGHVLALEGRYKEAEGPLLSASEMLPRQPGSQETRLQQNREDRVIVYEHLGKPDQAERFRGKANTPPTVQHSPAAAH